MIMPRRKIELEVKVEAMRECLHMADVKDISRKYGISERAAYNWYARVLEALPDILADDKPGRKPKPKAESAPPF
jgi:transposase-like protein